MTPAEDAWKLLDTVSGWLRHAETKLTTALGFVGVAGAALYGVVAGEDLNCFGDVVAAVATSALVLAGLRTFLGLLPQRRTSDPSNIVYYSDIADGNADADEYVAKVQGLSDGRDLNRAVLKQVFNVAGVADRKFDAARDVYVLLGISLLLIAVLSVARVAGLLT